MKRFKYTWRRKTESALQTDYIEGHDKDDASKRIKELWGGHATERGGLRVLISVTECEKGI